MLQKIIVIGLIVAAVVGLVLLVRKDWHYGECDGRCTDCPLARNCSRK